MCPLNCTQCPQTYTVVTAVLSVDAIYMVPVKNTGTLYAVCMIRSGTIVNGELQGMGRGIVY